MIPPIVKMTQLSNDNGGRYVMARLREPKNRQYIRLFLAFLKETSGTAIHEGHTKTSIKVMLASEGLPIEVDKLKKTLYGLPCGIWDQRRGSRC